jgi:hypothetical protein
MKATVHVSMRVVMTFLGQIKNSYLLGNGTLPLNLIWISMHMRAENPHEDLIKGYLLPLKEGGTSSLQPRRTLDQYFYMHLDNTVRRDKDQVVYRYTEKSSEPKIFMVDQLWLWVLDNGRLCLL